MKNLLKQTRFTPILVVLIFTLAGTGCRCGGGTQTQLPDFFASPAAVSFEACPAKDETGAAVMDVFPDTQHVTVENRGRAGAALKLSLTGTDKDMFTIGKVPDRVEALGTVDVPVSFSPTKKGDLKAELVVDDGIDGTTNPTVTLIGTGKNLPSQASIQTSPQKTDGSGYLLCQDGSPLFDCSLEFADTMFNQSATLQVKIKNLGCPTLKITGLAIETEAGSSPAFSIDSPARLPSDTSPILLSTADGTSETTVTIRFAPTDDGTLDLTRNASLVIRSNDKKVGDGSAQPARIALTGQALKPSIYVTPGSCDFSNPADLCGFPTAQTPHNKARFRITNGDTAVKLSRIAFKGGGIGGRFTISQNVEGQTLGKYATADVEVTHNDMPLYVSDQLDIEASLTNGMPAGKETVAVYGGKKPCLTTDPVDQVNFMNPATDVTAQTLKIKNGANCGSLIINGVTVDSSQFFSLIDPLVPAGTVVAPGTAVEATVQYKRPPSGGMQIGALHIQSNDSDFPGPQFKLVQLYSQTPLDQVPFATLTACAPSAVGSDPDCRQGVQAAFTAPISTLTPAEITLSGINSMDDHMVKEYRFTLLPPFPGTVTSAALANSGMRVATATTKLSIPPGGTGTYRVRLEVFDDRGQASVNPTVMVLNVLP